MPGYTDTYTVKYVELDGDSDMYNYKYAHAYVFDNSYIRFHI